MNKTEYKKLQITEVIKMLENDFKAEFTGDDEGGRLGFELNGFYGLNLSTNLKKIRFSLEAK